LLEDRHAWLLIGARIAINRRDEYGIPQTDSSGNNINTGKFQYTGPMGIR